ncbi:MAG: EI24 domain-containing protein [Rubrivivax sp.]
MNTLLDAFWRAALGCLHPRVILWSLIPLLLSAGATLTLGWLYWESAVAAVRTFLEEWALVASLLTWLESLGGGAFRAVLAPLIVVALSVPLVVVLALLLVAWTVTPSLVNWVAQRRFAGLQRRSGASGWWASALWSLGCSVLALGVLLVSLPLWFIPPLAVVIPPLVWGWLAARVFSFDTLALHATPQERRLIMHDHRWTLLAMGIVCGLLGSLPSLIWALGALTLVFAPLLVLASVWLYTLVFAFASLWFAHFTLAQLARLRPPPAAAPAPASPGTATTTAPTNAPTTDTVPGVPLLPAQDTTP